MDPLLFPETTLDLNALSENWRAYALCAEVDPDLWFPEKGNTSAVRAAKRICARCPVRVQCLDYAVKNHEEYGVWGGHNVRERRTIRADLRNVS